MRHHLGAASLAAGLVVTSLASCLPATNPYDPAAPPTVQLPGSLYGRVALAAEADYPVDGLVLKLRDASGTFVLDEGGDPAVFRTRDASAAPPAEIDGSALGTFEISLGAGTYTLVVDTLASGVAYRSAEVSGLEVFPGSATRVETSLERLSDEDLSGAVVGSVEGGVAGRPFTVRLVPLSPGIAEPPSLELEGSGEEAASFRFSALAPGASYRVQVGGAGYVPAMGPESFTLAAEHTESAPLNLEQPILLSTVGEVLSLEHGDSLAPYVATGSVDLRVAPLVVTGSARFEVRALMADHDPVTGSPLDPAQALPAGFADAWQTVQPDGLVAAVDLLREPDLEGDGPRAVVAQLRICFDAPCTDVAGSQIVRLDLVLDREPPRALSVGFDGDAGAGPTDVACVDFGSPCPLASTAPKPTTVAVQLVDDAGAVYGWEASLDDEMAPAFGLLDANPGLFADEQPGPALEPEDGEHTLRVWARDRAGNVAMVHERTVVVDVTAPVLASPGLVLSGTTTLSVDGTDAEVIPGELFSVDLAAADPDDVALWRVRRTDGPLLGPNTSSSIAYTGPVTVLADGIHRQEVTLVVEAVDAAGNVAESAPAFLLLWRTGEVVAQVTREDGGAAALLSATLTSSSGQASPVTIDSMGNVLAEEVLRGTYTLTVSGDGMAPLVVSPVVVEAAQVTDLGGLQVLLPRGSVRGAFVLEDGGENQHSGIQVSLVGPSNQAVAGAATLADGSYQFDDVPAGAGYKVVGSFEGYIPVEVAGLTVVGGQTTVVEDDGAGAPTPQVLRTFGGDFVLCAPPTGVLQQECPVLVATSSPTVEVGAIDLTDVTEFRIAFAEWAPGDDTGWQPLVVSGADIVPPQISFLPGDERRYTVWLQLRKGADSAEPISSSIIFDQTPPQSPAIEALASTGALLPGYTSLSTGKVRITADKGPGEVAGLANARVVFSDAAPASLPTAECPTGVACDVVLDDQVERAHTAWAFACDQAGNCSPAPVSAVVVLDRTPPSTLGTGVALTAIVDDPAQFDGAAAWFPVREHSFEVTSGTAAVASPLGGAAPEVVAVRVGLSDGAAAGSPLQLIGSAPGTATELAAPPYTGPSNQPYAVFVHLVDPAGNRTVAAPSYGVVYDPLGPQIAVTVPAATSDCDGTIGVTVVDQDGSDLTRVVVSSQHGVLEDYSFPSPADQTTRTVALAPALNPTCASPGDIDPNRADGAYVLTVQAFDRSGNPALQSRTVLVDRAAPQIVDVACLNCVNQGGTSYTQDATLQVTVNASDATSGYSGASWTTATQMSTSPEPAGAVLVIPLDPGAGTSPQAVNVVAHDAAGNASAPFVRTVVRTTVGPSVTLRIRGTDVLADAYTNLLATSLDLVITPGAAPLSGMRIANNACSFSGPVSAVSTNVPWTLASGADGLRTVCVEVTDVLGNVTTAQDTITLDTTPPGGTFVANGGNARTSSVTVPVTGTLDESARWKVGDGLDCGSVTWATANGPGTSASGNVLLAGSDGPHVVAVCARDAAGNVGRLQDEVELDRAGPGGAFTLASGATHSASATVAVSVSSSSADVTQMAFVSPATATCAGLSYTAFSSSTTVMLPAGNGAKTVNGCLADDLGNRTLLSAQGIVLDGAAPAASATYSTSTRSLAFGTTGVGQNIPDGGTTNDPQPVFGWGPFTDTHGAPVRYVVQVSSVNGFASPEFSLDAGTATLSTGATLSEGTWYWRVVGTDLAGNSAAGPTRSFTVDRTGPEPPTFVGFPDLVNGTFTAVWAPAGGAPASYRSQLFRGAAQVFNDTSTTPTKQIVAGTHMPTTSGQTYLFKVFPVDAVGNEGSPAVAAFLFDDQAPCASSFSVAVQDASGYTSSGVVTLVVTCSGETPTDMRVDCNGTVSETKPITPYQSTFTCALNTATQGTKSVEISVLDDAGNQRGGVSDSTVYDSVDPASPGVSPANVVGANTSCANITVPTGGALTSIEPNFLRYQKRANGGAWIDVPAADLSDGKINFSGTSGLLQDTDNLLELRIVDQAGNVGEPTTVFINEVSSALIATHLQVKSVCGPTGSYAILKDSSVWPTTMGIIGGDASYGNVELVASPEMMLLDLDTLSARPLNGDGSMLSILGGYQAGAGSSLPYDRAHDAICNHQNNVLLFAYLRDSPNEEFYDSRLVAWEDPFHNQSGDLGLLTEDGQWEWTDGTFYFGIGLSSLDAIRWGDVTSAATIDYTLLTTNYYVFFPLFALVIQEDVRQLTVTNGAIQAEVADGYHHLNSYNVLPGNEDAPDYRVVYGLAQSGNSVAYMHWDKASDDAWRVKRRSNTEAASGVTTLMLSYTEASGFSIDASPFGVQVRRPTRAYYSDTSDRSFLVSTSSGSVLRYRPDSSITATYATGAPAYHAFLDSATSSASVGWPKDDPKNRITLSTGFTSNANLLDFRYPIDQSQPIVGTGRTGAGEPGWLYHTKGIGTTQGVVVAYRNNSICVGD